MWSLRIMGGVTRRRQGELMSVLASSSGESTHDPPDGVLGRPVVVMDAFPRHGGPWCLSSPLSSRHHRCWVFGLSPSRSGTRIFHRRLLCGRFEWFSVTLDMSGIVEAHPGLPCYSDNPLPTPKPLLTRTNSKTSHTVRRKGAWSPCGHVCARLVRVESCHQ